MSFGCASGELCTGRSDLPPGMPQRPECHRITWDPKVPDDAAAPGAVTRRQAVALRGEHLVEQRLRLVLVGVLRQRQFADEDLPCLGEHALLAGRQPAL